MSFAWGLRAAMVQRYIRGMQMKKMRGEKAWEILAQGVRPLEKCDRWPSLRRPGGEPSLLRERPNETHRHIVAALAEQLARCANMEQLQSAVEAASLDDLRALQSLYVQWMPCLLKPGTKLLWPLTWRDALVHAARSDPPWTV